MNCHGWVQRIGRAFPPLGDSREDWRVLLELAKLLGHTCDWIRPEEIFGAAAEAVASFEGLSYESIGAHGAPLAKARPVEGPETP